MTRKGDTMEPLRDTLLGLFEAAAAIRAGVPDAAPDSAWLELLADVAVAEVDRRRTLCAKCGAS